MKKHETITYDEIESIYAMVGLLISDRSEHGIREMEKEMSRIGLKLIRPKKGPRSK